MTSIARFASRSAAFSTETPDSANRVGSTKVDKKAASAEAVADSEPVFAARQTARRFFEKSTGKSPFFARKCVSSVPCAFKAAKRLSEAELTLAAEEEEEGD